MKAALLLAVLALCALVAPSAGQDAAAGGTSWTADLSGNNQVCRPLVIYSLARAASDVQRKQ